MIRFKRLNPNPVGETRINTQNWMALNGILDAMNKKIRGEMYAVLSDGGTTITLPKEFKPRTTKVIVDNRPLRMRFDDTENADDQTQATDGWQYEEKQDAAGNWKIIELRRAPVTGFSVIAVHYTPYL